jgi:hypothetical protein
VPESLTSSADNPRPGSLRRRATISESVFRPVERERDKRWSATHEPYTAQVRYPPSKKGSIENAYRRGRSWRSVSDGIGRPCCYKQIEHPTGAPVGYLAASM